MNGEWRMKTTNVTLMCGAWYFIHNSYVMGFILPEERFCALYMELREEFSVNNPRIYPGAGASPLSFYPVRVALENEGTCNSYRVAGSVASLTYPQMNLRLFTLNTPCSADNRHSLLNH
jgi:hypothetical protein